MTTTRMAGRGCGFAGAMLLWVGSGTVAGAQSGGGSAGGTLTPRVEYGYIDVHAGRGADEHRWLQAVVLWRSSAGQSGHAGGESVARAAAQEYMARSHATELAGRTGLGGQSGGVVRWAEYDRERGWLYVLGQRHPLPRRDSALVVMVDRADGVGGAPAVVATARVGSELPDGFWGKHWESGDTLFSVIPRRRDQLLLAALQRAPAVRAFLE